jgi:hypothetical protein
MAEDSIVVEGNLDALEQEVESGLAARGFLRLLWGFAEWDGAVFTGGSPAHPTEEWIVLEEEA